MTMLELNRIYQGDCLKYLKNNILDIIWDKKKVINRRRLTRHTYQKVLKPVLYSNVKSAGPSSGENNVQLKREIVDFARRLVILYGNGGKRKPLSINLIGKIAKIRIGKAGYAPLMQKYGRVKNLKSGGNLFLREIIGLAKNVVSGAKKNIISESKLTTSNPLQRSPNCGLMSIMELHYVKSATRQNQKGGMFIA
jgi:hypothetical protein